MKFCTQYVLYAVEPTILLIKLLSHNDLVKKTQGAY